MPTVVAAAERDSADVVELAVENAVVAGDSVWKAPDLEAAAVDSVSLWLVFARPRRFAVAGLH